MNDGRELTHIDLFSGIGGFALAAGWAGFRTIAFVEIEPFCQEVLRKHWPDVPIHDDIRTFKWTGERPTLITGGFPCQPVSAARKRRGKEDDRWLWPEMLRVISEAKPRWVIGENVAGLINMGLDEVLSDLEGEGYETGTLVIPACAKNAPHRRDRVWICAHNTQDSLDSRDRGRSDGDTPRMRRALQTQGPDSVGSQSHAPNAAQREDLGIDRNADNDHVQGFGEQHDSQDTLGLQSRKNEAWEAHWIEVATRFCRVDDGLPAWIHARRAARLKALGNAIVPQVAAEIIKGIADIERGKVA